MSILPVKGLGLNEKISSEDFSIEILYHQVTRLRNKVVSSVKVVWRNHLVEGETWEAEADMKSCYPHFFPLTPSQG